MKNKKSWALMVLCLLYLISCQNDYPYERYFIRYMQEVHKKELKNVDEAVFYLLPIDTCEPCLEIHRNELESFKIKNEKLIFIFIGKNKEYQINNQYLNILYDVENKANMYRLGLGKAMLLYWRKGKVISHESINDFEIEKAFMNLKNL